MNEKICWLKLPFLISNATTPVLSIANNNETTSYVLWVFVNRTQSSTNSFLEYHMIHMTLHLR
jgi:hypothetical protein